MNKNKMMLSLVLALCLAFGMTVPAMAGVASVSIGGADTTDAVEPVAVEPAAEPIVTVDGGDELYETPFGVKLKLAEGWLPVDEENFERILSLGMGASGLDGETAAQVKAAVDNKALAMFYAPDVQTNFNINYQEMTGNTQEIPASMLITAVWPSLKSQMESAFQGAVLGDASAVTIGDVEYMTFKVDYSVMGMDLLMDMYMYCPGERLYTITVTFMSGDENETYRQQFNDMVASIQY